MSNMKLIKYNLADPSMLELGDNVYITGTDITLGTIYYINKADLERSNPADYLKVYYIYDPNDFETTLSFGDRYSFGIYKIDNTIKIMFAGLRSDNGGHNHTTAFFSDMQSDGTFGRAYMVNEGYTDRPHSYLPDDALSDSNEVRKYRIRIPDFVYKDVVYNPQDTRNPVWLLYTFYDNWNGTPAGWANKIGGWEWGGENANNNVVQFVTTPTDSSLYSVVEGACMFKRVDSYGVTWNYLTYSQDFYTARYNIQWRKAKTVRELEYATDHCLMGANGIPAWYTNSDGLKYLYKAYGGARVVTYNWQGQDKVKIMYHVCLPAPGFDAIYPSIWSSLVRHTVVEDLEFTANGDIIDLAIPNL